MWDLERKITEHRRKIHSFAEVGFKLSKTQNYVKSALTQLGIKAKNCGRCGVVASIVGEHEGESGKEKIPCVLLRADMDALPIKTENCLAFSPKNENFHACGHDMHTAMLLGAAEILSRERERIFGEIRLMFQPAEELLCGALDMIEDGVLKRPTPAAALMLHVIPSSELEIGALIVSGGGINTPSADFFRISIKGVSAHGGSSFGVDALRIGAELVCEFCSKNITDALTHGCANIKFGSFSSGKSANTVSETATLTGVLRTLIPEKREEIKAFVKQSVIEFATSRSAHCTLEYTSSAPALICDGELSDFVFSSLVGKFGAERVVRAEKLRGSSSDIGGSEDFSYIAERVPSIMLGIVATQDTLNALHSPRANFSEKCLISGARAYAEAAMALLSHISENNS